MNEKEQIPVDYTVTKDWLREAIDSGEYVDNFPEDMKVDFTEVSDVVWQFVEKFRQAEFSGSDAHSKIIKGRQKIKESLKRSYNPSEKLIMEWTANLALLTEGYRQIIESTKRMDN